MGQKCSSGDYKAWDNPYSQTSSGHSGGANTGDPRWDGHGSSASGGGMGGSNKCVPIALAKPNPTEVQVGSTNVFDTTANRLEYISPIHT